MKAMVLAAGLGTRLRPLTNFRPKALLEVRGKPLLEHVLIRLIEAGVTEVIINLHHFPEQIKAFLQEKNHFGISIVYSEEDELLDTGGGLKKAAGFFCDGEPFFLHNADVLSTIDLSLFYQYHLHQGNLATLAVQNRKATRYLVFDDNDLLCGRIGKNESQPQVVRQPVGELHPLGFCGIHVISPELFDLMHETGAFSIIDVYLRLTALGKPVRAFHADAWEWSDMGKPEQFSLD